MKQKILFFLLLCELLVSYLLEPFYSKDDFISVSDIFVISITILNMLILITKNKINNNIFCFFVTLILLYLIFCSSNGDDIEFSDGGVRLFTLFGFNRVSTNVKDICLLIHVILLPTLLFLELFILWRAIYISGATK